METCHLSGISQTTISEPIDVKNSQYIPVHAVRLITCFILRIKHYSVTSDDCYGGAVLPLDCIDAGSIRPIAYSNHLIAKITNVQMYYRLSCWPTGDRDLRLFFKSDYSYLTVSLNWLVEYSASESVEYGNHDSLLILQQPWMAAGLRGPPLRPVQQPDNQQVLKPDCALIHHRLTTAHCAWTVTTNQHRAKLSQWIAVSITPFSSFVVVSNQLQICFDEPERWIGWYWVSCSQTCLHGLSSRIERANEMKWTDTCHCIEFSSEFLRLMTGLIHWTWTFLGSLIDLGKRKTTDTAYTILSHSSPLCNLRHNVSNALYSYRTMEIRCPPDDCHVHCRMNY